MINDADYDTRNCPFFDRWSEMRKKCYCPIYQKKYPEYVGCTVCEEWQNFSVFRKWMETQDWVGKYLDKDLLGSVIYGPTTCVFVPIWLNSLFSDLHATKGDFPRGISKNGDQFDVYITLNFRMTYLGKFSTIEEAKSTFLSVKKAHVRSKYHLIKDDRVLAACERLLTFYDS